MFHSSSPSATACRPETGLCLKQRHCGAEHISRGKKTIWASQSFERYYSTPEPPDLADFFAFIAFEWY